ncbi:alaserpin-like isoform X2 [Pieris brassicae]|uniref:alaserpin-like isoform X2 n=1 Tax=Pieris brassicae TaxID=7116 RepID=UPI001E660F65|nr:alaserpin-like isoform X2 [Pieris brassicae]XP_045513719.1 alaserpin-like isoform X2 [Pieris brassicae]
MKLALFYLFTVAAVTMAEDLSRDLRNGNEAFTSRMFSEIVKEKPQQSVVLSAYSVLTPLAQLALASEGESHDELLKAIGMPNDNVTKAAFSQAERSLKSVKGVELKTASKIYIASKYELNENFATTTRDVFNSEVKNVDFTQAQKTASEINAWVEDQTNKKIKDLVDPDSLDATTSAVLVNAIYFKGLWKSPFSTYATYDQEFHITKEKSAKIPMMSQKSEFNYAEVPELDAKILQMFYEGDEASMVLVLPNEIDGINKLEEKLRDPSALNRAISSMYSTEVEVTIPKFKIETTTNLKDVLSKMEVTKLFTPGEARLNNLIKGQGDLVVSEAIQKAFIEVNEEGAEAAAANEFGIALLSAVVSFPTQRFNADHSFLFYLKAGENIIFNGAFFN